MEIIIFILILMIVIVVLCVDIDNKNEIKHKIDEYEPKNYDEHKWR